MPLTVTCPTSRPSSTTPSGIIRPARASRSKPRTIATKVSGLPVPSGWVASQGASQSAFAERTALQVRLSRRRNGRRVMDWSVSSIGHPVPIPWSTIMGAPGGGVGGTGSMVSAADLVHGVHQDAVQHLEPVLAASGRARQVHDQRPPG